MHRKLAWKFAQDASNNSMKKLADLFKDSAGGAFDIEETLREIAELAEEDAMQKNLMTKGASNAKKKAASEKGNQS